MDFQEEMKKLLSTGFEPDANPTTWIIHARKGLYETYEYLDICYSLK